jgi:hypothetical protein
MKLPLLVMLFSFICASAAQARPERIGYQYVTFGDKRQILCRLLSTKSGGKASVQVLMRNGDTAEKLGSTVERQLRCMRLIPQASMLHSASVITSLPKSFTEEAAKRKLASSTDAGQCLLLVFAKPGEKFPHEDAFRGREP